MDPTDERFDAKMTVLDRERPPPRGGRGGGVLPEGPRGAGPEGAGRARCRPWRRPRPPHRPTRTPRSPDTPPGNVAVGLAAGLVDRLGDTVSGVAQGSVTAVQRSDRPHLGPAQGGGRSDRLEAAHGNGCVRAGSRSSVTDDAIEAARQGNGPRRRLGQGRRTRRGPQPTAPRTPLVPTKAGAKGTVTSARKSAKRTATTAKRASTSTRRTATTGMKKTTSTAKRAAKQTTQAVG